jgi:DNA-directed RNA polymerase II subunit RPB1
MKSTIQPSKIIGIQFSIGSPEEIRKNSVVEVTTRDTYINNKPVMGGLFDPKMGVLEPGLICPTDGLTYINTPGYFGHIEMARPVIFIQHLKDIMKILKCVCFKCSRLLLNKKQHTHVLKMSLETRWDYVSKLAIAIKRCGESTEDGCGCKQPGKIKLEGMATLFAIWEMNDEVVNMRLTPEIILKIFRRISDEDIAFMGFSPIWSRPEWMICQVLPVPPPAVRPSVKHDAQQRSEDDLTHIYSNIIKTNRDLLDKIQNNAPANVIEGLSSVLQYFVAMIVNNKVKGAVPMAQRSGRPLQCISGRLNSKNGRVRGNLMGKRVDFSARSVITGDPNLSIRQLGVPMKVAKNITKPVSVNELNRDFLLALVRNGPDEYPGAKILERKNGESISLRYVDRGSIRLEVGDVVHRHMMDGDAVLFNRQPSLHRNSMMCHIVKVMKVGDTFRINVGVTKPYNADFDGDEMNMHMPQNVLAETELRHLAAIPYQLISPTSNSPIIGIYQDSMLGSFQFTRERVTFTPKEAMNLLMMYPDVDVSALRKKAVTNFEVLSQIFPPVTMVYKNKLFKDAEEFATSNNVFELRNGQYMRGRIDKSVLGSSTKGVIHRVFNDYGNMAAANFIDNLQNIITEYMKTSSFSVGISDLIANKITQERIVQVIADKKMEVQSIINQVHLGVFENSTANTNAVEFETRVNNILNKATEQSGKIGRDNLGADNRFVMIVDSGSKGSPINISQMISCLGQQNVDGKRIPYGFNDRTLPHFAKFDDSPIARGFIEDSYITGLTAPGLFFHAMGGRIGLIDTAVKTSKTGYIQRRLIKGMEYYQVYYDMTVRNDKGYIVQFSYGDDGIDSTKVENQSIPLVGMSLEDIYMHYDIPGLNERDADLLVIYNKSTITRMRKQREETRLICQKHIADMQDYQRAIVEDLFKNRDDNVVRVPVAFQNIIANIQGQFHLNAGSIVDITPKEAFELIETYFRNLQKLHYAKPTKMFEILYYFYLSPKDLLVNRRFHQKALVFLLETITLKYKQAIVSPGENVGVIAGQSIGEPTTQLTLNSVVYETEIVVRNHKQEICKVVIGDFIQEHIAKSKVKQVKCDVGQTLATTYAELDATAEYYEVPCATESGETVWRRVEAVTQHPVVNEDGTDTMLRIRTKGCREVIATKAKSFLQLVDGRIVGVEGKDLAVGDYLPVSKKALVFADKQVLDLRELLPCCEYLYGSEYKKAREVMDEYHWWQKHNGTTFVVPHSRSDSFVSLAKSEKCIAEDCVYMKLVNMCEYKIPEKITLDAEFGYLLGAYCAEGCMTKHQMSISNNDIDYLVPIENICKKFNITTKVYKLHEKSSQDIRIYNTLLCNIVSQLCGKLSHNKYVSEKIVFSNQECIIGFLNAYISGDGCIAVSSSNKKAVSIDITSVSLELLSDVSIMLKNIGIISQIHKPKKIEKNNKGSKNIHQHYILTIRNKQAQKLAPMLSLTIKEKQDRLNELTKRSFKYEYDKAYLSIPNIIDGKTVMQSRNGLVSDLLFDQIVSIEEVPNTTKYAYDLTVEDTRNFDIYNGLCMRDTFHLAGVATKSNVTRGVPRIEEILRLTKNPSSTSMTVYLKPVDEFEKDRAEKYSNMIEHTKLKDVVKSVQIFFDPNERSTFIQEDQTLLDQFYEFEDFVKECNDSGEGYDTAAGSGGRAAPEITKSKWIIRMEMDAEQLLDKNITMDDIHFALMNSHTSEISCVYSDYNSDKLVFRIRMNTLHDKKKKKVAVQQTLDQSDEIYLLQNFQDSLLNNIVLRGITGINNVMPRKLQNNVVKEDGRYVKKESWILDTNGSNLMDVLALDYIDNTRTFSNDIKEMFDIFGIEAARQAIFNEFTEVMEFSDVYINYHHLSLLCDRMTSTKDLVPIFRSGILNDNIGPIAKATFEVHTEVFLDAARHADFDAMRGVSANVMCGQYGNYGTGSFGVVLDMKTMGELSDAMVDVSDDVEKIDEMFGAMSLESKGECSKAQIEIKNYLSSIKKEDLGICEDDYDMGF